MNYFSTNQECSNLQLYQALPLNTFEVQICLERLILLFAKKNSNHADPSYNQVSLHVFVVCHF